MIIDFHIHAFHPKVAEKAVGQLAKIAQIEPYTHGLIEQTIERFDEWGVDKGVLLPVATKPTQHEVLNNWSAEMNKDRIIAFGGVHPDGGDEAISELDKYLDDACLSHLNQVRVVHGKGTGALRKGVHEYLKRQSYVKSFRLGEFGEGDAGATLVEL